MRTLVVSDLHLGAVTGVDLLRRARVREPLVAAVADGVRRLVVLGDGLELREVPVRAAAEHIEPLLREVGEALGPGGEVVLLAGNHDHGLLSAWMEAHLLEDPPRPMTLAEHIAPQDAGPLGQRLAAAVGQGGATLSLAYPGIWLREDVYATHGHYLDVHTTVPTLERLAAGLMERVVSRVPAARATPDDYEAVLAPLYAWMGALAQRSGDEVVRAGSRSSAGAYAALAGTGRRARPVRGAVLRAGFTAVVKALDAGGLGPLRAELTGEALRQGYLRAMGELLERLEVRPEHVLFGHTHRSGPWPDDDPAEWRTPAGTCLHNTGSWVYQRHFLTGVPYDSPYWPGTAIALDDAGPPRLLALLGDLGHEVLGAAPDAPPTPAPA